MSETTITWCAQCGTQRDGDIAFCGSCGSPFSAPEEASTAGAEQPHASAGRAEAGSASDATMLAGAATWATTDQGPQSAPRQAYPVQAGLQSMATTDYTGPQSGQFAPQQPTRKSNGVLLGVGAGIVVVAAAVAAFALLGQEPEADEMSMPVVTATVTAAPAPAVTEQTQSPQAEPPAAQEAPPAAASDVSRDQVARTWPINETVYDISAAYPRASSLNGVTSRPFAGAVGEAYAASGANGGSTSVTAYSPTTKRSYTMWCEAQPDTSVLCTGGNNARVLLW